MRISVSIRTNKVGSECVDEFDIDANTPEHEIEECAREAAFQMIEWDYEAVE